MRVPHRDHVIHRSCVTAGVLVSTVLVMVDLHLPATVAGVLTNLLWVWGE